MDIRIEGLCKRYSGVTVIDDLTLDIADGEILCVIGPSGCGKSTLLRLLGGLEEANGGRILQMGPPPPDSLNPLTFVFQDFALLPWRTVEGNVSLVLEDCRIDRSERHSIIDDVLQRTKLADFRGAYPRQLSGGMKQRVGIARALAVRPAVLFMDEPLSSLDAQTRELLMDDLVDLWERERFTCVYVTHNLEEAVRLGHRIVVLSRRPARIRAVLEIEQPLRQRSGQQDLIDLRHRLWEMLRDEAAAADREVVNAEAS